ncbi:SAYSvFN domain-containing protein 1 [Clarias gariepinus]|uniref:SAYSvFN domain-containing protein 1 n=1 Tax=Clarias gariepinus TaxID=13013 RepID=UPI00234CE6F0|nr:SAYSvFN domain-containing protein 1 [Clarias gariepinus]
MEQKLAEFRARRKVEKPATKPENRADSNCSETHTAPSEVTESTETHTAVHKENRDWLLDSAIGRWLGIQRLAVTNLTVLKVLLWLVLLGLFSELDFGLPFFLLSLFYWLYEGLRSPVARRPGEMSAYSVFNPNCQPILGTLTAEQLEGEMGYRPLNRRVNT